MIKKNLPLIIITSVITLLPAFLGSALPVLVLFTHLLLIFVTGKDKKNEEQNEKVFRMVFWICPLISVFSAGINYWVASGREYGIELFVFAMLGVLFIVIGNYLPKCKQNYTIGIKIPWVYTSEENWNRTHRFGGKVWVLGGVLFLFCAFLPDRMRMTALLLLVFVVVLIPMIYSFLFYRKEKALGLTVNPKQMIGNGGKYAGIATVVLLIFVGVLLFTGNIEFTCGDTALAIEASYWNDTEISYENIKALEYRTDGVDGSRTNGFGSARLLMGTFRNDEFGYYTRYSYTRCDSAIVLTLEKNEVVISGENEAATKALYEELKEKIEG